MAALALVAPSFAAVKRVSSTPKVKAGKYASLTVRVAPKTRCTIAVVYDTVVSQAKGLGARIGGKITWRRRVGTSTHPGRWPVTVNCGKSGKLKILLRVTSH